MEITLSNCNNIDKAVITIEEEKLNIKFAPNGAGKSTIARALLLSTSDNENSLDELTPFKFRAVNPEGKKPTISGADSIKSVLVFNESYVNQFVFQQDELLNNSFDILIKTEFFKEIEKEIEDLISEIKLLFVQNQVFEDLISTLKEMRSAFKLTKSGLSKSSTGEKALSPGNKIEHIPPGLETFKPFIQSEKSVAWIGWQTKGYQFTELADDCPFCTSPVADKKDSIQKVGQEYDSNTIKNLLSIIDVIERLGDYFSEEAKTKLKIITSLKDGLNDEHRGFLVELTKQIDNLVLKLEKLRTLSGFQFKDDENVSDALSKYRFDLLFFQHLNTKKTQDTVASINSSIDSVIEKSGKLQGKVTQQRKEIKKIITKHQNEINEFLTYAGYKYQVAIMGENEDAKLKLLHIEHTEPLNGGNQHLSFGERNAFAIVLFMYECLAKKPDLIILDDPISSFDKNKKYAILEMLFRRNTDSCLKNKTVIMLTHDVEPIIDTVKTLATKFNNQTNAAFLRASKGNIEEKKIIKSDIKTFPEICKNALESNKDDIIKLIYLRRYYEIINDKNNEYQVISNLLHKREHPIDYRKPKDEMGHDVAMEQSDFAQGCEEIRKKIGQSFSYEALLQRFSDTIDLNNLYESCQNGYEKLQVFRLFGVDVDNSVIQKFINETYHIENEFVCQLDPSKFDIIPEYVVEECDTALRSIDGLPI